MSRKGRTITAELAIATLIHAFEKLRLPYMLTGGLASSAYGVPREGNCGEFVWSRGDRPVREIMLVLGRGYRLDPQSHLEAVTGATYSRIAVRGSPFAIELFELSSDPHDQERFRRRTRIETPHGPAWVPQPEDVVIQKLRWAAALRRPKDLQDLLDVLSVTGPSLDWPYIAHWTATHGTTDLLADLRKQTGV